MKIIKYFSPKYYQRIIFLFLFFSLFSFPNVILKKEKKKKDKIFSTIVCLTLTKRLKLCIFSSFSFSTFIECNRNFFGANKKTYSKIRKLLFTIVRIAHSKNTPRFRYSSFTLLFFIFT